MSIMNLWSSDFQGTEFQEAKTLHPEKLDI